MKKPKWACAKCKQINWASRVSCRFCGAVKDVPQQFVAKELKMVWANWVSLLFEDKDVTEAFCYVLDNPNSTEFTLEKDRGIPKDRGRQALYKLQAANLMTYRRIKDKDKGWYISYWKVRVANVSSELQKMLVGKLSVFEEQLEKEKNNSFYFCRRMCVRLTQQESVEAGYLCPECRDVLVPHDNSATIRNLQRQVMEAKSNLGVLGGQKL